ncbi:uncharacterized protein LOC132613808 isoform X2 [Lycium barbarum]|uniref:uncharacterized protein LOC132613808 isoform X2 n=1 Tax=Lycium barbarum TaxID=112863 RepID=UPI00293E9B98|nr:uncharacterized protein LOC132613808 isoform X2 [Lycium barbarum]
MELQVPLNATRSIRGRMHSQPLKYPSLKPLLNLYVPHNHRVLIVGCGNSAFSEGMVDDGYEDVVNVDISSVVIEAMQKKYSDRPQLKYMKMDTRDMSCFEGGSFDGVVDKGTLDSILCGQSSQQNAAKMLSEVGRLHMECQFSDSHC